MPPNPADDRQMLLLAGWRVTAVVEAALRHRILELAQAPGATPRDVATACGWDERGARLLLTALRALRLLDAAGDDTYVLSEDGAALIDTRGREAPIAELLHLGLYGPDDTLAPLWNDLGASIGRGGAGRFAAPDGREDRLAYLATLRDKARRLGVTRFLCDRLVPGDRRRLLDLGGSSGVFSFALAERYPDLQATILDLPEMVALSSEFNEGRPHAARIAYHAADFFADTLPPGHDVALMANIVHDWTAEQNRALIRRAASALAPRGLLAILDVLLPDDAPTLYGALFGIDMFLVAEGEAYAESDVRTWMREAGLDRIAIVRDERSPYTLVVGERA